MLTRSADTDFVGGDSLRLRDDLKARVDIARRIAPDLFMSLHHNADPGGDHTVNEIQVYYRLADEGPSLDVACAIASHLVANLGEERNQVVAGNYYVLRNAAWPAVLCEPSFISNPRIEEELRLDEKQWLEAAAYFLGIVEYFARGVPEVVRLGIAGEGPGAIQETRPLIEVVFDDNTLVDASTAEILLDGQGLAPTRVAYNRFVGWPPSPLGGGKHTLAACGRAYTGNSSREARAEFEVITRPASITLRAQPQSATAPYPQKVTALVLDANGMPVTDSTQVDFTWATGARTMETRSGEASVFVGREVPFGSGEIAASCGGVTAKAGQATPGPEPEVLPGAISGLVVDCYGNPVPGATLTLELEGGTGAGGEPGMAVSDRDGFFTIPSGSRPTGLKVAAPGFRQAEVALDGAHAPELKLERFYLTVPAGSVVTLDPQGGGDGLTTSALNLAVARRLKALLESVGIRATLTRDDDRDVTKVERVKAAEAAKSDLVVSIDHEAGPRRGAALGHYFSSPTGQDLAAALGKELKSAFGWTAPISDNAEYFIQQTSAPAAKVTFFAPRSRAEDASLAEPYQVWARAYALACGIVRYLGVGSEAGSTYGVSGRVTLGGKPASGAVILLDGALEVPTDANGSFDLRLLAEGVHTLTAFRGSAGPRSLSLDGKSRSVEIKLD